MREFFHPVASATDDYAAIRANGMWYQSWQSGYNDILKRGIPRPADARTILAELHSPNVPSFLHGGTALVPFLVTSSTRDVLEGAQLTGFEFAPVVVAKLATKGVRARRAGAVEPEDVVLKAGGVDTALAPTLHAVYVSGAVEIKPDYPNGRDPGGWVSPFELTSDSPAPDLWRPWFDGKPFSGWAFCSARFRAVCDESKLTNIAFDPFDQFMSNFRSELRRRRVESAGAGLRD